jgi:prolyl-tRNA synthetase
MKEMTQIPTEKYEKPKNRQGTDMNSNILTSNHCKLLANFKEAVQLDSKTQHATKKYYTRSVPTDIQSVTGGRDKTSGGCSLC